MEEDFSQIVKIRLNKASGDYSVNIPFDLRELVKNNKYVECRRDPATGGILYIPLNMGGVKVASLKHLNAI
jgi:hypothetical protein